MIEAEYDPAKDFVQSGENEARCQGGFEGVIGLGIPDQSASQKMGSQGPLRGWKSQRGRDRGEGLFGRE